MGRGSVRRRGSRQADNRPGTSRFVGHVAAYHSLRLPKYAGKLALRAPRGLWKVIGGLFRWLLDLEGEAVRQATVRSEDSEAYLKAVSAAGSASAVAGIVAEFVLGALAVAAGILGGRSAMVAVGAADGRGRRTRPGRCAGRPLRSRPTLASKLREPLLPQLPDLRRQHQRRPESHKQWTVQPDLQLLHSDSFP